MYKLIFRPLLFLFAPETIHHFVVFALRFGFKIPGVKYLVTQFFTYNSPKLQREVFGIQFSNPVGLAAGFDKNAEFYNELSAFGFSFIEVGTITPKSQPGNPRPRSFRLKKDSALINRMGFNNKGLNQAKKRLKERSASPIIGGNIGKNTLTPNEVAVNDYLQCFVELYNHVDYFVVNISCPNITNLQDLQDKENLKTILLSLANHRKQQPVYKPILLKVSPDLNEQQLIDTIEISQQMGLDGFVATNTSTTRNGLVTDKEVVERIGNGGLSGKPIKDRSNEVIKFIANKTQGKMPIIGVGGIMNVNDAIEKLNAGASLVQLYTGFIYEGPGLAKKICKTLVNNKL